MNIPLSNPDITDLEKNAVIDVLKTPNLSFGPKIPKFEEVISNFANIKYAVALSSGTSALHLIVKSLNVTKKDYFLTTPFSFVASLCHI